MKAGGATLQVTSVTRKFGAHLAVDSVSLSFEPGGIHGLIGPNGSGKSTLLNIVSGILAPDTGRVAFGDQDITDLPPHRIARLGVARTFQNLRIFRRLSVFDNVCAGRAGGGGLSAGLDDLLARRRHFDEIAPVLSFVGLLERANDIAQDLPLGAQRRLELARALAARPRLLLLDEPAGGMTPVETDRMASLLSDVAGRGISVILVEHKMKLVMGICRRVAVLDQGRLIACGSPDEVQAEPIVREAYMGRQVEDA